MIGVNQNYSRRPGSSPQPQMRITDSTTILVLSILDKKRAAGAEVDPSTQDPPPRCHPETRKELRERITSWVMNVMSRDWDMMWLTGPAGVGKSTVAQTIAKHCQGIGRLGASFFFLRLNDRTDPSTVIPTFAYRLATNHGGYRNAVTQIIADDRSILDKTLRCCSVQNTHCRPIPFAHDPKSTHRSAAPSDRIGQSGRV